MVANVKKLKTKECGMVKMNERSWESVIQCDGN